MGEGELGEDAWRNSRRWHYKRPRLLYGGVYGSPWKPLEITTVFGLGAYKSTNTSRKNLNSTEIHEMKILNPLHPPFCHSK